MKKMMLLLTVFTLSLMFAGAASAHVTVLPKESVQGAYEKFTVRVPSEKEIPTVKVEVRFPTDTVAVSRFEPKPGWAYEVAKDATGKITGVTWTAQGPGLSATEFTEFNMQGKVGDTATAISWKAYQTYQDGSVVEWTGAPDAKTPASVTTVKPKTVGTTTDSHGHIEGAEPAAAGSQTSGAPLYLSITALILGAAALLVSLLKKAR